MEEFIPIAMIFSIAAVLILRPVTKRLGLLLEALARERHGVAAPAARGAVDERYLARMTQLLEQLNTRMELIEDRVDFVERLSDGKDRDRRRLTSLQ